MIPTICGEGGYPSPPGRYALASRARRTARPLRGARASATCGPAPGSGVALRPRMFKMRSTHPLATLARLGPHLPKIGELVLVRGSKDVQRRHSASAAEAVARGTC